MDAVLLKRLTDKSLGRSVSNSAAQRRQTQYLVLAAARVYNRAIGADRAICAYTTGTFVRNGASESSGTSIMSLQKTQRSHPFLIAFAGLILCASSFANAGQKPPDGKLGFVVKHWFTAIHQTRFMDECPAGLNIANDEYWWRGLSNEDQARLTDNGLLETLRRWRYAINRGPNGEDVCAQPDVVTDPPLLTIEGDLSFGIDLDGTTDGAATPKSCPHDQFTGLNGDPGVDNQMYRLLGCIYGWRNNGIFEVNADEMRGTSGLGMILIDVSGVDDVENDDDVTVSFYRSIDQFAQGSTGEPVPFTSYRVDTAPDGTPRYGDSLKGSIKDGVLSTESGDIKLPFYGNYTFNQHVFRDMSIELTLSDDGETADGMVYGYYDLDEFIAHITGTGLVISTAGFSCPAFTAAARQLADGYPDPETGDCTSLSSAFKLEAHAAFIIKPDDVGSHNASLR